MAGGDNIEGGKQVVSALHSIPFGNIIGGPLAACVHAQAEASQTTLNFIRGFTMADSGIDVDGAEPLTVTFSFVMNGVPTQMTLPLMTLVPIPYMRIEHIDLSFTADITACSNEKMEARYASEGYRRTEEDEKSVSVQSKMGIHVRATTSDMPSGMARMLDFFANNLIVQETLTAQEVSDMRLEAARQRAIRSNNEAEKARIEEQERQLLHQRIALLIRDLKHKKEAEEARDKQLEQLKESASRPTSVQRPVGGDAEAASKAESDNKDAKPAESRPTSVQRPSRPSSVLRPVRPTSVQRPVGGDAEAASKAESDNKDAKPAESRPTSVQRPSRPTSVQRPVRPSSVQRPVGRDAEAASKAESDNKDAKPAESQQSESQPTRVKQLLRGQMLSLDKKAINVRNLRKKK